MKFTDKNKLNNISSIFLEIYVHEFDLHTGHSHAMIETLNKMPNKEFIKGISVISYTCQNLDTILKDFSGPKKWVRVPLMSRTPMLLKAIFYHLYCFFFQMFRDQKKKIIRIGIGTACLNVDICNIQFIQKQWAINYFKTRQLPPLHFIYKKLMYAYFIWNEHHLFKKKDLQVICLAKFIKDYCQKTFGIKEEQLHLIYSGVNLKRFNLNTITSEFENKNKLLKKMQVKYPALSNIDTSRSIYLFIGAYQRKGLAQVLENLKKRDDHPQLIVIGKSEAGMNIDFPKEINTVIINFTRDLPYFYALSDCFIFPTIYEPFGLVIIEAAAMGCQLIIPEENTGASEILKGLKEVYLIDLKSSFPLDQIKVLSFEQKKYLVEKRLPIFNQYSWDNAGKSFETILIQG